MHSIHDYLQLSKALACSIQKLLGVQSEQDNQGYKEMKDTCNDCKLHHTQKKNIGLEKTGKKTLLIMQFMLPNFRIM